MKTVFFGVNCCQVMRGHKDPLNVRADMTDAQIFEAVRSMLGPLTPQQVTEFLLSEYGDLVQAIEHTEAA
jgi:hypothetical protein